jgi:hypothetical protein
MGVKISDPHLCHKQMRSPGCIRVCEEKKDVREINA